MATSLVILWSKTEPPASRGFASGGRGAGGCQRKILHFSVGILTENCVLRLKKIPSNLLYSPLSGNPAPSRANPGATPVCKRILMAELLYRRTIL